MAEIDNMQIQKAERKVERKLRELIKKVGSLEDKIDELQENWRVDINRSFIILG